MSHPSPTLSGPTLATILYTPEVLAAISPQPPSTIHPTQGFLRPKSSPTPRSKPKSIIAKCRADASKRRAFVSTVLNAVPDTLPPSKKSKLIAGDLSSVPYYLGNHVGPLGGVITSKPSLNAVSVVEEECDRCGMVTVLDRSFVGLCVPCASRKRSLKCLPLSYCMAVLPPKIEEAECESPDVLQEF